MTSAFTPTEPNTIALDISDAMMEVTRHRGTWWWYGRNVTQGSTGNFPPAYVTTIGDDASEVPSLKERNSKKGDKEGGTSRAASIKWWHEVESKKGSGMDDDGGFASWFHGVITRADAETLLTGKASGTFLIDIRIAESRFGYTLSLLFREHCTHFMINLVMHQRYQMVGNNRTFRSLREVVAFHQKQPDSPTASC